MKNLRYARKCDACACGMNEGYCIENGEQYCCSEVCLTKFLSKEEYFDLHNDGEGSSYWTAWEENDFQYEEINGKLIEI